MSPKAALLTVAAKADVEAISHRYMAEAGVGVAIGFLDALDDALRHIGTHPSTGSLRYGEISGVTGLRFWPLRRFPHLVFYLEGADRIDVLRVLHGKRDIPASLRTSE